MINIQPSYHPFSNREIPTSRNIAVYDEDDNIVIRISVGIVNRRSYGNVTSSMLVPNNDLFSSHIVVAMDVLGNMSIVKNLFGVDGSDLTNLEVREELMNGLQMVLSPFDSNNVMVAFNRVVSRILDQPVIINRTYPLGINYRDYMLTKNHIIRYHIKKHKLC